MTRFIVAVRRLAAGQRGASIVEYALLFALITIVCLAAMSVLGTSIRSFVNAAATSI
jgi:Flp pilus assembly pilin Flp